APAHPVQGTRLPAQQLPVAEHRRPARAGLEHAVVARAGVPAVRGGQRRRPRDDLQVHLQRTVHRDGRVLLLPQPGHAVRLVAAAEFSSPSAVRFHRRVDEVESGLRGTAARLTDLADALDRLSEHYQDLYLAWKAGA